MHKKRVTHSSISFGQMTHNFCSIELKQRNYVNSPADNVATLHSLIITKSNAQQNFFSLIWLLCLTHVHLLELYSWLGIEMRPAFYFLFMIRNFSKKRRIFHVMLRWVSDLFLFVKCKLTHNAISQWEILAPFKLS